jgi:hypothetical protein
MKLKPFSETKDDSIRSLLRTVESAAVSAKIEVVDNWDADRHSIGFHRVGAAQPLLYVTTWQLPSESYKWYLETEPGVSTAEGVVTSSKALLEVLKKSLIEAKATSTPHRRNERSA